MVPHNDRDDERPDAFRVGLVQMACSEDRSANLRSALDGLRRSAASGAQIVCLQELFATRYFPRTEDPDCFDLAEPIPGPSVEAVSVLCAELEIVAIVPVFERRAPGVFHNSAVVIDADGSVLGTYRKMHIPDDPQFYEKFYFAPGDTGYRVFRTRHATIGVLICWDQWFPEAARLTSLHGAEVLIYPTAIGWLPAERDAEGSRQFDAWRTVQRGHAIANGVYLAAVNRVGLESGGTDAIHFWGGSFVCDPHGEIVAEADLDEEVLVATCSRRVLESYRRDWPFFRDRRIDSYSGLLERFIDNADADVRESDRSGDAR